LNTINTTLGTKQNTLSNASYLDVTSSAQTQLNNKQAILNSTSSNAISCLSLATPTISLNSVDLTTTLSSLAPKASPTLTTPTINGEINVNNLSVSGSIFSPVMSINYTNPSISYNIYPNYLGTFYSTGCSFTNSGLPLMSNQSIGINWCAPIAQSYVTTNDSYMNCAFVEITYWIQESPVNTTSSTFPSYLLSSTNSSFGYPFVNTQSSSTTSNTVNLNVGNLFCAGTGIYYIANSISTNNASTNNSSTGYNSYIKYISGSFSGAGGSLTSSTNRYNTTFTPVVFSRNSYNRVVLNFNFPANNNTTNTNTYGTGQYISSYGATARLIGSDAGNGSNQGLIFPNNNSYQNFASYSYTGRSFFG
jgi:hypothetical protein